MDDRKTMTKPKRRKPSELRRDILAAAEQVFSEKGYAGASTREIADKANAAEPLIFRHFEKKASLFATAVFEPIERVLDEQLRLFYEQTSSPIESARNYVEAVVGTIRPNKRLFIAYLNALAFHGDEFSPPQGTHVPPSFQTRLAHLERTSPELPNDSRIVIRDRHYEVRLILLFLCSVALFDDLFFDASEQDDEREITSIVKLLTMGMGVDQASGTIGDHARPQSSDPGGHDQKLRALEEENRKLRTLLTDTMLELFSLKSGRS